MTPAKAPLRVALLGFWHVHAIGYGRDVQAHPSLELVIAWDSDALRGRAGASALAIPLANSLDEILSDTSIDAVICETATADHEEVIARALRAGKHVFSDKVLAATGDAASRLVRASDECGVILYVGLPVVDHDYVLTIRNLIRAGEIGAVVTIRFASSHGGAVTGDFPEGFFRRREAQGGALIDLCHGLYVVPFLAGETPTSVSSMMTYLTRREVEDNAVVSMTFPSGAIGLVEASFASASTPFALEVSGTEACLRSVVDGGTSRVMIRNNGDAEFRDVSTSQAGPSPIHDWAHHMTTSTRATPNLELAVALSGLTEAAYRSAQSDRTITGRDLAEIQMRRG